MEIITSSPLFGLFLSFICFGIGTVLFNKFKTPLLNPLLFAVIGCIAFIQTGFISYDKYMNDTAILANLLPAATALLAVNIYKQIKIVKKYAVAIIVSCLAGSITSIACVITLCKLFGVDKAVEASFIGKSCTTPIALDISLMNGGMAGITVITVICTGIVGAVLAPSLAKLFKVNSPVAEGIAIGTCSHVVGTTKAVEIGDIQAALSGVAIGICGLITVILTSIFY